MHGDQSLTSFASARQLSKGLVYGKSHCTRTGMQIAYLLEVLFSDYGKRKKKKLKKKLRYAMSVGY